MRHWHLASLYIDWQPNDVTEGACPAGWWRWGAQSVSVCMCSSSGYGVVRGVINEGWNVECKQTRPRHHLSFTKLSQLSDFFFPPSPWTSHHHPSILCHPLTHSHIKSQRTHFLPPLPPLSFSSLNVEHWALEFTLSSVYVPPLLRVMCPSACLLLRNGLNPGLPLRLFVHVCECAR